MKELYQQENIMRECKNNIKRLNGTIEEQQAEIDEIHEELVKNIRRLNEKKKQWIMLNEHIDEKIEEWHKGDHDCELHKFLDMSVTGYKDFVEEKD